MRKKILFVLGPIISSLFTFLSVPMSTWIFSKEEVGAYLLFITLSNIGGTILGLGLVQYFTREYFDFNDKIREFKKTLIPGIFISLLLFVIFGALRGDLINHQLNMYFGGISTSIIFSSLATLLTNNAFQYFRISGNDISFFISHILSRISPLITLGLGFSGLIDCSLENLIFGYMVGQVVVMVFLLLRIRIFATSWSGLILAHEWKSAFYFALPMFMTTIISMIISSIDRFFIEKFLNLGDLGLYSVALTFGSAMGLLSQIITTNWYPQVYKLLSNGKSHDTIVAINELITYFLFSAFLFFTIASSVSSIFLPKNYFAVNNMVSMLLLNFVIISISDLGGLGLTIVRRPSIIMVISIITFVVTLIAGYILIPRFGLLGVALMNLLSGSISLVLRVEFSRKYWIHFRRFRPYLILLISFFYSFSIWELKLSFVQLLILTGIVFIVFLKVFDLHKNVFFRLIKLKMWF
jgi:O-antigen/teichoic acid export membrane protein